MTDHICGKVTKVIDAITFEMNIDFREKGNHDVYLDEETIRLADPRSSALDRHGRKLSHSDLKRRIWNRQVMLQVIGRDDDDRVIAYVSRVST